MDARKTIERYILPRTMIAISLLLVAAALVFGVVGVAAMGAADSEALEFYPNDSQTGSMAYIDVVGISGWLYKNDDAVYYTALDREGYLYTVRLSDNQYEKLSAQYEYWMDEDENAVPPSPFRLEGLVKDVSADTRSTICEVWGLTAAEYDQIFGKRMLDATTSAGEAAAASWFFGTMVCGLFGIALMLVAGRSKRNAKKCLKVLKESNRLELAAAQLENPTSHTVVGKNKGVLTQDFLFGKGTGIVVAYSDIIWAYQHNRKRNFVPVNSYLMVGTIATAVEAAVDLNRNDKHGVISQALEVIAQQNPDAMIGYSVDNGRVFSAIRKGK